MWKTAQMWLVEQQAQAPTVVMEDQALGGCDSDTHTLSLQLLKHSKVQTIRENFTPNLTEIQSSVFSPNTYSYDNFLVKKETLL